MSNRHPSRTWPVKTRSPHRRRYLGCGRRHFSPPGRAATTPAIGPCAPTRLGCSYVTVTFYALVPVGRFGCSTVGFGLLTLRRAKRQLRVLCGCSVVGESQGVGQMVMTTGQKQRAAQLAYLVPVLAVVAAGCGVGATRPTASDDAVTLLPVPSNVPPVPLPSDIPQVPLPGAIPNVQLPNEIPRAQLPADLPHVELPAAIPQIELPSAVPPLPFP